MVGVVKMKEKCPNCGDTGIDPRDEGNGTFMCYCTWED